ncbi:BrnT family toxin [Paludibaculum fermentans]|uniref:BrnT family toxin n=1 Tax=Paludibaculum fermentans TaxID=1473598 RepID=UPI003EB91208
MHNEVVSFEWDEASKAGINFRKHGVRMPEAIPVFEDAFALTVKDEESDPGEQRFVTLGLGALGRLLVVVYTWRGENIRIISVRVAEAHEREEYEAGL